MPYTPSLSMNVEPHCAMVWLYSVVSLLYWIRTGLTRHFLRFGGGRCLIRLCCQPVRVVWVLWSTGTWKAWRNAMQPFLGWLNQAASQP